MTTAPGTLRLALAQLNPTLGDVEGNLALARTARADAQKLGADAVMFPELFLAGYPPEDLVLKPAFQDACRAACEALARETADGGPAVLIGLPWAEAGKLYNAYAVLDGGRIEAVRFKVDLPNYGVFDEKRVFASGPMPGPVMLRGIRVGLPNGSPYFRAKADIRLNIAVARVTESRLPLVYLNQVGGQDDLVFDGASFVLNADSALAVQMPSFQSDLVLTQWSRGSEGWHCADGTKALTGADDEADYAACVLGLKDYVDKNRFPGVVLGLSGGIDSAICAAMAVDALGADRVHAVMLPFHYTSSDSLEV